MYVECPHCHAIFALPARLEEAPERVRCGECNTVFTPQPENTTEDESESAISAESKAPLSIDDFLTNSPRTTTTENSEDLTANPEVKTEKSMDQDIMDSFQNYLDGDSYPEEPESELPDLNAAAPIVAIEDDPLAGYQTIADENETATDGISEINHTDELLDDESSDLISDSLQDDTNEDEEIESALPDIQEELVESPEEIPDEPSETVQQKNVSIDTKPAKTFEQISEEFAEGSSEEDKQTLTGEFRAFIDEVDGNPLDLFSADRAESIYEQQFLTLEEESDDQQADLLTEDETAELTDDEDSPIAELNQVIDDQDAGLSEPDAGTDTSQPGISDKKKISLPPYTQSTWFQTSAGLFLLLILSVQYLHFHHKQFAAYPETRSLIKTLCGITGCSISPQRNMDAIELLNHGIYSHPTTENALIIKALIRNQADYPQPYPTIELSLADLNDRKIALRRFGPGEYLSEKPANDELMPVNKNIPVHLQVMDPGQEAVAFEFEFL